MFPPRPLLNLRGAALLAAAGAAALAACGDDRRAAGPVASTMRGPDAVLLRVPRAGGRVSAAIYPRLDSAVWRSRERVPPLARVLAFDAEGGQLAAVDTAGLPVRVDLRLGTARVASRTPLGALAAAGGTFYGVGEDGAVTRLTSTGGEWRVRLAPAPQVLYPQRDGSVLAAGARGGAGVVWVLRPPTAAPVDSVRLPGGARPVRLGASDRVYFAGGSELLAVQARTLAPAEPVALGAGLLAAAASPSGDRLFVLTERPGELSVVDRYAGAVAARVRLPGAARDLRVDPLGRYLLVRPAAGDSAWVVAVGTGRVLGAARGAWRQDLPLVLPDGAILTATNNDVTVLDGETLRPRATVAGGAADFWHFVLWNGFRPRAAGLDQPATFRGGGDGGGSSDAQDTTAVDTPVVVPDTGVPPDTAPTSPDDTTSPARRVASSPAAQVRRASDRPTVRPARYVVGEAAGEVSPALASAQPGPGVATVRATPAQAPNEQAVRRGRVYTVQFAAAPTEREARRALRRVQARGTTPRVVPRVFDGKTVYRVVAGPYASRAEAERAGRSAGAGNYWIYVGAP